MTETDAVQLLAEMAEFYRRRVGEEAGRHAAVAVAALEGVIAELRRDLGERRARADDRARQECVALRAENEDLRAQAAALARGGGSALRELERLRTESERLREEVRRARAAGATPEQHLLDDLVEDRRRLLEALGVDELGWLCRGGVYFSRSP